MIIGNPIMAGASGPAASIFVTGLSETDTVTATNGAKTLTGKWSQKPNPAFLLPPDYTQLEYIESTGTQYIDTGFGNTQGWRTKLTYMFNDLSSTYQAIIGDLYNANGTYWRTYVHADRGRWSLGFYSNSDTSGNISAGVKYEIEAKTVSGDGYLKVDGNSVFQYKTTYSAHPAINTYLFAVNYSSTLELGSGGKLYCCNLYDHNDMLVREFVPAKRSSDNAIGLYDKVEGRFYVNAGTGTFIAGPEIPQTFGGFLIKPIRDLGTWTVTATDGTKTATQDVLVDVITDYVIEMSLSV